MREQWRIAGVYNADSVMTPVRVAIWEGHRRFLCAVPQEIADQIVRDRNTVLEAVSQQAAADEEVERMRGHLIEIEAMAARHEESAEWRASAAIPAILGRARRALRGDANDATAPAGAGEAVADHLWSGRDDSPPHASIRGVTTCCTLPQAAHPGLTWDSVRLFVRDRVGEVKADE